MSHSENVRIIVKRFGGVAFVCAAFRVRSVFSFRRAIVLSSARHRAILLTVPLCIFPYLIRLRKMFIGSIITLWIFYLTFYLVFLRVFSV